MASTPRLSPLSALAWHRALSSPDQRDKLFRLLQYALKLLHAFDGARAAPGGTHALEGALGTTRQLSRLCKWLSVYATTRATPSHFLPPTARAADVDVDAVARLGTALTDSGLFSYYALDNCALAAKLGLLARARAPRLARAAAACWLVALGGALLAELARQHGLRRDVARRRRARARAGKPALRAPDAGSGDGAGAGAGVRDGGDGDAAEEEESVCALRDSVAALRASRVKMARIWLDVVVAWSLARPGSFGAGAVGAAGSVSSALSLYLGWPRAA